MLGAGPRAGGALRRAWLRHPPAFRRRALALFALVAVYAVVKLVPVPGVSCEISAVKECPPSDDAIAFVPADAFAYLHVSLDPDSSQLRSAREVSARLPHFEAIAQGLFASLSGRGDIDLARDVEPWLGDEAAFAEVPVAAARPEPLLIAALDDEAGAQDFLAQAVGQPSGEHSHGGSDVAEYAGGLASAERDGFLLFGGRGAVESAIDAKDDSGTALAADATAQEVRSHLPDLRFADAFLSADGLALLQRSGGAAGPLDIFTDTDSSRGLAVALVASADGLDAELSSDVDPAQARTTPGFLSAFPPFRPSLASLLDPRTFAVVQIGDPAKTVGDLLEQADALQPGISAAYRRLKGRLARTAGFDIDTDVLPALGDEMAIGIAPGPGAPYITAAFGGVDPASARSAVARLAGPLIGSLDPAKTGQAPTFSQSDVEGVRVDSLQISPTTTLYLAAFDRHLMVTTDPHGVRRAIAGQSTLAEDPGYQDAGGGSAAQVSALVFLDLGGLVSFSEPLGLADIRNYVRFKQDFARLGALGVSISSDEDSLDTDISLQIEQGDKGK